MLSWKAPLRDGGSGVTQYIVEKLEPPMTKWIRCATTRFTHCAVEHLSATKQYQFRVCAENLNGRSVPCEPSSESLLRDTILVHDVTCCCLSHTDFFRTSFCIYNFFVPAYLSRAPVSGLLETETVEVGRQKKGLPLDDLGRRRRGMYDGPKIDNYDKFCTYIPRSSSAYT